ncbi:MAG: peptidoglycan DD-metalloendopeptidase family protein [Gammaproteobacteria bacterium]|jgi:murein DD-endopeptidase MepM/ murein hydrolase activator NlpD|nr:peptidoglycan DD-metalloendopeptidase family protein [Gammaproteobacteria bacterium]
MRDYKPQPAARQPRASWLVWFIVGLGLPLLTVALLLPQNSPPKPQEPPPALSRVAEPAPEPAEPAAEAVAQPAPSPVVPELLAPPQPEQRGERVSMLVRRGDSLDRLFKRNGFSPVELALMMREELARKHLKLIRPGDEIVVWHEDQRILALQREINYAKSLRVARADAAFTAEILEHTITARQVAARGRIGNSLFLSAAAAGMSDRTIMNLAGIFAWDIDFVLDIRQGDEFHVIVEELWRDGERVAEGDILAAKFVNQGEVFQAIRYVDPEGTVSYFTPDGENMRKAFLRAPLSFSRVSSNFNPNRRHPVLNTLRAHKGVDYAAPHGTPVKSAGDGKVIFRGTKGGYGNTVIVQHGGNITTLYAHLSRFDKATRVGARVRQGEVIAYVGQSGLATGPHLHYEYRKNGVHMNPRTVPLPDAAPIKAAYREDFERFAAPFIEQLDEQPGVVAQATTARAD